MRETDWRQDNLPVLKAYMYLVQLKSKAIDWDYLEDAVYEWVN